MQVETSDMMKRFIIARWTEGTRNKIFIARVLKIIIDAKKSSQQQIKCSFEI